MVAEREPMVRPDTRDIMRRLEAHLQRSSVSLKPAAKRVGVEAWFPYYAGYSSDFVAEALFALDVRPGWRVLDPWNGSGTTTAVADPLGCDTFGYDINPVAALVAAARLTRADDASHSTGLAVEFLSVARRCEIPLRADDPLLIWLSARTTRRFRAIQAAIVALLGTKSGTAVDLQTQTPPPFASFFLLCLIRAAKRFIRTKDNSNPTWITPSGRGDAREETLDRAFLQKIENSASDAERAAKLRASTRPTTSTIGLADARSLPLPASSVDAVVTSPPYCTRIDYFRATLFELAALGIAEGSKRFRELRATAMGTNLMRPDAAVDIEVQPEEVQRLLWRIRNHASKASSTYYFKHFAQYFDDVRRSLAEVQRVLKPGATAVVVVQSSYYKDIPVRLGELYAAIGKAIGTDARVVLRVPVRRVLATINPRAAQHAADRRYTEDVVALQRVA